MTLTPGTKLGPYEILAPLGAGGMGEVYKAKDARLDRFVAIKVLPEHLAKHAESLARFEREAKAVAALNHPNITGLFDLGREGDAVYAVMELLQGETLRDRLKTGPLSPRLATELGIQLAQGLAAAHEKGVVHRDLKPENLWITTEGRLKILDFGLAKQLPTFTASGASALPTEAMAAAHHTEKGMILGTLGYMSPEQVRGDAVDARSDLFSFGAVLFEMLSGQRPFARETASDTMAAILRDDPPEASEGSRPLPPGLRRIVDHCLEKLPARRFRDAQDLAFALENLSSNSAESSSPAHPAAPRPRRWAPTFLVLGLLGLGAAAFLLGRAPRQATLPTFRKLTFGRGAIDGARFIPGSQDLAYSARWQGDASRVYLLRPGSPEPRALDMEGALLVGTTGQGAAVITSPVLNHGMLQGRLSLAPLAGGGIRGLSHSSFFADFAPDGSDMVQVTHNDSGGYRLEWPQGTPVLETSQALRSPRLRGTQVAFFREQAQSLVHGDLMLLAKGGAPRLLTTVTGFTSLAWGPGGRELWFSTYDGGESLLQAVSLSGSTRLLARHPGRLELVDVDPEGRCLVIASSYLRQACGRAPGAERDVDLTWLEAQHALGVTDDGTSVLLGRAGDWALNDQVNLYLRPLRGGPAVNLGQGSNDATCSPDGRWVATLEAGAKGQMGIRLTPTGPGAPRWIPVHSESNALDTLWFHPTLPRLYFSESGDQTFGYVELTTGITHTRVFLPKTAKGYSMSTFGGQKLHAPDGRKIVLQVYAPGYQPMEGEPPPMGLLEAEGTMPRSVSGIRGSEAIAGWDARSEWVYVYDRNLLPAPITLWNPATGARKPFLRIEPPDPTGVWGIQALRITPSGHAYAYSIIRRISDLYLLEGLR